MAEKLQVRVHPLHHKGRVELCIDADEKRFAHVKMRPDLARTIAVELLRAAAAVEDTINGIPCPAIEVAGAVS